MKTHVRRTRATTTGSVRRVHVAPFQRQERGKIIRTSGVLPRGRGNAGWAELHRVVLYLTFVVHRQPLVRLPLVVEHPGETAVRPVAPHGATRGPVAALTGAGDVASGVLTAVGAPDDLGLVRARHASRSAFGHSATMRALSRTAPHAAVNHHRARTGAAPDANPPGTAINRTPRRHVNTARSARGHIATVAPRDAKRHAPEASRDRRQLTDRSASNVRVTSPV